MRRDILEPLTVLKALADPGRLVLARLLSLGAFNVSELTDILGVGQSTVSRNLRLLVDAGLLVQRREGRQSYYAWRTGLPAAGRDIRAWLLAHGADLDEETGRRVQSVWEARRERSASFFAAVDPTDPAAAWMGSADCVPMLLAAIPKGAAVLDLGTGSGRLLVGLSERADRLIGVDASPTLLEEARRRMVAAGRSDVDLRLGDLVHLPVGDAEVDAVVANMVLHHVPEPARILPEIRRVLRPGGTLLIGDFLPHDREWMRETLADQWLGLPPSDLTDWLDEAGFDSVDIRPLPEPRPGSLGVFVARAVRPHPPTAGVE